MNNFICVECNSYDPCTFSIKEDDNPPYSCPYDMDGCSWQLVTEKKAELPLNGGENDINKWTEEQFRGFTESRIANLEARIKDLETKPVESLGKMLIESQKYFKGANK